MLLTTQQVADRFKVTRQTILSWTHDGRLHVVQKLPGNNTFLYDEEQIMKIIRMRNR